MTPPADLGAWPRWRVFPVLALGTLMATFDISVVNIALPSLSRDFGVPLTTIEWVVLAYVLTITGLLLTLGRVADRYGRRRVYGLGLALFTIASALCAAAPGAPTLIAARTLQGFGAAMMTANSAALLVVSFPPAERGRALGPSAPWWARGWHSVRRSAERWWGRGRGAGSSSSTCPWG